MKTCGTKASRRSLACHCLVLAILTSTGCRNMKPASPEPPAAAPMAAAGDVPLAPLPDETPLDPSKVVPPRPGGEGTGPAANPAAPATAPLKNSYPSALVSTLKDPATKLKVNVSLDAAEMEEAVSLFAKLLDFGYTLDPMVKGKVTVNINMEMKASEVWLLFEQVLSMGGAYASPQNGCLRIMPMSKMGQDRRIGATEGRANVEVMFITVVNGKSAEMATLLKPFLSEGGGVFDIQHSNSVMVVDAPDNLGKLVEIARGIDIDKGSAWPRRCLQARYADAEAIKTDLEAVLKVMGLPVASDSKESDGRIRLAVLPRQQIIVASAALPEALNEIEEWFRLLDRENQAEQETIFFYNAKHSTAQSLNEVLGAFFNCSSKKSSPSNSSSQTKTSTTKSVAAKASPTSQGTLPATTPGSSFTQSPATGSSASVFETPVVVFVDDLNNRLTIRTNSRTYSLIEALLRRQDIPTRQVAIEAVVAEITLTKSTEFGFSYAVTKMFGPGNQDIGKTAMINGPLLDSAGNLVNPAASESGLAASLLMDKGNKIAFIRAVAGDKNVRILSAPQITTVSDEEAKINVGARVPVKVSDYTDTLGSSSRSSYQYENTGTILTVKPYITAGNEVRVNVEQEVSSAVETKTGVTGTPTIMNKKLSTTLVVPDRGTIMMGGLIDTVSEKSHDGIPILMDIPLLGWFFRSNSVSNTRTELVVLLTVRVIDHTKGGTYDLASRYQEALLDAQKHLNSKGAAQIP